MDFMGAVEHVFRNYAVFEGRARRSEFWYFQLFHFLVVTALGILSFVGIGILLMPLYLLGSFVPNMAVTWRRYHDIGRSGAWFLISYVPLVGLILSIVWLAQDSQPGDNQYGPNPKGVGRVANSISGTGISYDGAMGSLAVRCLAGPLQGQTYPVRGNELLFGREAACGVRLPDSAPGVSRRHCCIRWQQGMPVLIDLNSSYGTFLGDGKRLPPQYPEPVAAGTRFYLGNRGILFEIIVF